MRERERERERGTHPVRLQPALPGHSLAAGPRRGVGGGHPLRARGGRSGAEAVGAAAVVTPGQSVHVEGARAAAAGGDGGVVQRQRHDKGLFRVPLHPRQIGDLVLRTMWAVRPKG